jgi:epoxyqueuosine reductase
MTTTSTIRKLAYQQSFDLCGFTQDFVPKEKTYFLNWLKEKRYGEMHWLNKNTDKRLNPQTLFEDTQSVIVVACSYAHTPDSTEYKLARYAHGEDYHIWMKQKLEALAQQIQKKVDPNFKWRSFVDTGPVLERDLSTKAGLGWVGKNTNLISKELGSYLFLGVLFCNLKLTVDRPHTDQCANCTLCLEACPTQALKPYQIDASQCLAYHNIEKRGERDSHFFKELDSHLIGCDICQEVCPWNFEIQETQQNEWKKSFADFHLGTLEMILELTPTQYRKKTKRSAVSRIKFEDFMRNVFLVMANTQRHDLYSQVQAWTKRHPELCQPELNYYFKMMKNV